MIKKTKQKVGLKLQSSIKIEQNNNKSDKKAKFRENAICDNKKFFPARVCPWEKKSEQCVMIDATNLSCFCFKSFSAAYRNVVNTCWVVTWRYSYEARSFYLQLNFGLATVTDLSLLARRKPKKFSQRCRNEKSLRVTILSNSTAKLSINKISWILQ